MASTLPVTNEPGIDFPTTDGAHSRESPIARLIEFDRRRPGIPGEHLMTAAVGGWLIRSAARRRSMAGRLLSIAAGGLLLARSASGREGWGRFLRPSRRA